jgi:hypothetical protein
MGASAGDYMHEGQQDIAKTNFSDDTPTVSPTVATINLTMSHDSGLGRLRSWLGWGIQF